MRASVVAAWPTMCRRFEGVTTWMYLDTKGLVTTGVGFLINTVAGAQALPWQTKDGKPATPDQIKAEWNRVHGKQTWKKYNGLSAVWKNSAVLSLPLATVDAKLLETTNKFWSRLGQALTKLESFPADAQLALMDESWQNGPAFLDPGTSWTNTRAGALAQDWAKCASSVPGSATSARTIARKRLFNNAAKVVKLKLDPEILWDTKTPVAPPVVVPPVTPDPTPTPEVPVALSQTKRVEWKNSGKYVDERTHAQLEAVEEILGYPITMYQGSWSDGSLSADTHAGAGAADVGPPSRELETACRKVGMATWWRHLGSWSNNQHCHALSIGNSHLASWAKVQVEAYKDGYDGLGSNARASRDTGNRSYVNRTWEDVEEEYSMPSASEVAKEVVKQLTASDSFKNAVADAVLERDVVENNFTANDKNPTVATKTALSYIGKDLDAILAVVKVPTVTVTPPPVA